MTTVLPVQAGEANGLVRVLERAGLVFEGLERAQLSEHKCESHRVGVRVGLVRRPCGPT